MQSYKIVSREYMSNCLVEAIKAKIRSPKTVKLYFLKPYKDCNRKWHMFHFMWTNGKADYDFSDLGNGDLPLYKCALFKGVVREFPLGFITKYIVYRDVESKIGKSFWNIIARIGAKK